MRDRPKPSIVYCPKCGHSADRERLSIGSDDCTSRLRYLTETEWLGESSALRLTDAGKRLRATLAAVEDR